MSWLALATIGQFIGAIVVFLDKYIVTDKQALPRPFVYAFYSCLLTGGWVLIYFLGYLPGLSDLAFPSFNSVKAPSLQVISMAFLTAYTFFMALVSLYDALKQEEAVNVMPIVGATSALSTLGLSYLFLNASLTSNFLWGIIMLIIGTFLVAHALPGKKTFFMMVHSGFFFGLHYITMKGLFLETSFDDGFFWSRVCFVLFALSLLMVPSYFAKVTEQTMKANSKAGVLVLLAKILAGVSAFLLLKATHMGDVSVVQAMDGMKFVFILLITVLFSKFLPEAAARTETRFEEISRQVLYVVIISIGYFILFFKV